MSTPCGHVFCAHCLLQAYEYKRRCPSCRLAIPADDNSESGPSNDDIGDEVVDQLRGLHDELQELIQASGRVMRRTPRTSESEEERLRQLNRDMIQFIQEAGTGLDQDETLPTDASGGSGDDGEEADDADDCGDGEDGGDAESGEEWEGSDDEVEEELDSYPKPT
ncbi:hypothetical protein GE061_013095 [Apolygus lucorum]|uniref:Uncharacterized protein n=1 Tax=Apolygus lucorum TaxID=248454 RepID=A0A6A4IZP5_APOLU|nr:hypothetical protein GE061_013095 [Apolygus lucorum]